MEKLKGSIYITAKEIQILNDCSLRTAKTEHRRIRDSLGIKHGKLTIKQYINYWGIDYDLVIFKLNDYR
ncbi:MAG: hypothetical protein N4A35_17080 [Flavobacteriales bacterium]|jgi:hypothetical protein|nr:hypothetical protein [Flavobacteriales bacterium]